MLAALAMVLLAQLDPLAPVGPIYSPARSRAPPVATFQLLASGAGTPLPGNLCTAAATAGLLTGSYWCIGPDGVQATAAGQGLTATGSVVTASPRTCPSGPDCTATTAQALAGGAYYVGSTTSPTTSFSVCEAVRVVDPAYPGTNSDLVTKFGATAADQTVALVVAPTTALPTLYIGNGSALTTVTSSSPLVPGALTLVCATYSRVGAGTSVATLYLNGVSVGASATAVLATTTGAAAWTVNGRAGAGAFAKPIQHRGVLYTGSLLSAANIATLTGALFGGLSGARGEAVTYTRDTPSSCVASDGAAVNLSRGVPCVGASAYWVDATASNLMLWSEALEQWTIFGSATVTANTTAGPDGIASLDTLNETDASGRSGVRQTPNLSATGYATLSCWLAAGTMGTATLTIQTSAAGGNNDCNVTLTATPTRYACTTTASTTFVYLDAYVRAGDSTHTTQTGSIVAGRCQLEVGQVASAYVPTLGGAVQRNADTLTTPIPTVMSRTEGCAQACVRPRWTGATPGSARILWAGNAARLLYNSGGTSLSTNDGVTAVALPTAGFVAGARVCYRSQWSAAGNLLRITKLDDGTSSTAASFASLGVLNATLDIGSNAGTTVPGAGLDSIVIGPTSTACP